MAILRKRATGFWPLMLMVSPGLSSTGGGSTGDPLVDGARHFFGFGCASCHGLDAESGVVGGDLLGDVDDGFEEFLDEVRRGPEGMPQYPELAFGDAQLANVHAYLESLLDQ